MGGDYDPRLTPARADVAAEHLRGKVTAERFESATTRQINVPVLDLYSNADEGAELASQLLFGEQFDVYDQRDGLAWGQNQSDGYVGYVPAQGLGPVSNPTHKVTALRAHIYEAPHFKSRTGDALVFASAVSALGEADGFILLESGYISARHVSDLHSDWVAQAERFLGTPYLWGGRSSMGLDCSALVQLSLMSDGVPCPRDSDMQLAELGDTLHDDAPLIRGDLVFWKGHVGIMSDAHNLLHANVHHMCVSYEPIDAAIDRIKAAGDGPVLARKRI